MTAIRNIELPRLLNLLRHYEFPRKLGSLDKLFGRSLSRCGVGWVDCWNGVTWKLDLADPSHRWIVYGKYEGGLGIDFACRVLNSGGVFVDSGANIGQWTLYLAGLEGVRTLAFEPVLSQRDWLAECIRHQNGWNVSILEFGLGAREERVDIQCDGPRSTLRMDWYQNKALEKQTIEIVTLSDALEAAEIEKVQFWKLDVEGAELSALVGAREFLKDHRIENIFFECHPSSFREAYSLLKANGYQVYNLDGRGLSIKGEESISTTENLVARPLI